MSHISTSPAANESRAARLSLPVLLCAIFGLGFIHAISPPAIAADASAPQIPGYALTANTVGPDGHQIVTYRAANPLPAIRIFTVHSETGDKKELAEGAPFPTGPYGIVAEPFDSIRAVKFTLDGQDIRVESIAPLSFSGDANGKIFPVNPSLLTEKVHTLVVTPYLSLADATAVPPNPLPATTLHFTIAPQADFLVKNGEPLKTGVNLLPNKVTALERGGTWQITSLDVPDGATLKAFGPSTAPPKLKSTGGPVIQLMNRSKVTLQGLSLEGDHIFAALRVCWGSGLLVNDCEVMAGSFGITVEGDTKGQTERRVSDARIVGCYIHDNFSLNPDPDKRDASGIFSSHTDGLVIDSNLLDNNGWDASPANAGRGRNMRNHNIYIHGTCGPAELTNNILAHPSSHGAQMRSGGVARGNLFIDCPIGLDFGNVNGGGPPHIGGVTGEVSDNVFLGGADMDPVNKRGIPLEVGNILKAAVRRNFIGNYRGPTYFPAINLCACKPTTPNTWEVNCVGIVDLTLDSNVVFDWGGPWTGYGYGAKPGGTGNKSIQLVTETNNRIRFILAPPLDVHSQFANAIARVRSGEKIKDVIDSCVRMCQTIQ